jgi:hypothetical protein
MKFKAFIITIFLFTFCFSTNLVDGSLREAQKKIEDKLTDDAFNIVFNSDEATKHMDDEKLKKNFEPFIKNVKDESKRIMTSPGTPTSPETIGKHFLGLGQVAESLGKYAKAKLTAAGEAMLSLFDDDEQEGMIVEYAPTSEMDCFECLSGEKFCFGGLSASDKLYAMAAVDRCDIKYLQKMKEEESQRIYEEEEDHFAENSRGYQRYHEEKSKLYSRAEANVKKEIERTNTKDYRRQLADRARNRWSSRIRKKEKLIKGFDDGINRILARMNARNQPVYIPPTYDFDTTPYFPGSTITLNFDEIVNSFPSYVDDYSSNYSGTYVGGSYSLPQSDYDPDNNNDDDQDGDQMENSCIAYNSNFDSEASCCQWQARGSIIVATPTDWTDAQIAARDRERREGYERRYSSCMSDYNAFSSN